MGAPDPGRHLLVTQLRSRWRLLVPAVALLCLWQACEASVPILIGMIVDLAIVPRSVPRIAIGLAVLAVLFTVLSLGYRFGSRLANEALNHTTHELRVRVARQVLDPRGIRTSLLSGELLAVATSDADRAGAVFRSVALAAGSLLGVGIGTIYLLTVDWLVSLVVFVGVAVALTVAGLATPAINRRSDRQQETIATASGQATDLMEGLRVLNGIGGGDAGRRRYARASRDARDAGVSTQTGIGAVEAIQVLVLGLLVAVVLVVAGLRVIGGHLTTGELIAVVGLATFLAKPIGDMIFFIAQFALSTASGRRIHRVLTAPPSVRAGAQPLPEPLPAPALQLTAPVGLSVSLGENVALVCPDPARADLLARVLTGEAGEGRAGEAGAGGKAAGGRGIAGTNSAGDGNGVGAQDAYGSAVIFGVPRTDLALASAREALVVAPHHVDLFEGTLRSNILLARQGNGQAEGEAPALEAVLDASATAELIGLFPEGLEHQVAAGGSNLSGGQRQRISLARALMADPPLLVLMDPTTAVDAVTEQHIAAGVATLRRDRATLVFTTSPAFLAAADRVVYLGAEGARTGRHGELMQAEAGYRELVTR